MISLAAMTEDMFMSGNTYKAYCMLKHVPLYQMQIYFDVFKNYCRFQGICNYNNVKCECNADKCILLKSAPRCKK